MAEFYFLNRTAIQSLLLLIKWLVFWGIFLEKDFFLSYKFRNFEVQNFKFYCCLNIIYKNISIPINQQSNTTNYSTASFSFISEKLFPIFKQDIRNNTATKTDKKQHRVEKTSWESLLLSDDCGRNESFFCCCSFVHKLSVSTKSFLN